MLTIDALSYWERDAYFSNVDFLIIGAGIVGLSAALELKKKHKNAKILVLERGYLPSGASTKNAGFACFGSATELIDDLGHIPKDEVWNTVAMRWEGLQNLKQVVGEQNLRLEVNGSWDLITKRDATIFEETRDRLEELNRNLEAITKEKNVFAVDDLVQDKFGFEGVTSSFYNRLEGQVNTGSMIKRLYQLVVENDIQCLFGIEVLGLEECGESTLVQSSIGEIKVAKVAICTNGFAQQFVPKEDVLPARAQVLITKPIQNLGIKGTFHYDMGYYYFRNIDNRILLGGGRNLDFEGETTTSFEQSEHIQSALKNLLEKIILPHTEHEIDYFWSGIMGVGSTKKPIIKLISKNVGLGVRMGGMGVAIGSLVGRDISNLWK